MLAKPLSDRVLETLPRFDHAPLASEVAAQINFDVPRVRAAFEALEASGRARIVRRGKGLHLVPADYPGRICPVCRAEVTSKHARVKCCSKVCSAKLMWQTRDRAKQGEVLRATHRRLPEKMHIGVMALRGNPAHRQFVSERNRKDWADPVKKMQRVLAMETAWQGSQADARRENARRKKQAAWDDPAYRQQLIAAMREGKRGRYQRALMGMVADGSEAEEIASRTGRTIEQTKVLWRRLYRLGKVDRGPADGRRKAQ